MKVIDLFSGVGGFSLGFSSVGFDIIKAVEFDQRVAYSYKQNHKNTKLIVENIQKINIQKTFKDDKGKIDVIIGGPPCQGFSLKGKKLGMLDKRNYLFKNYFNIVKYIKPNYFVMENVANMASTNNKHFYNKIKEIFSNIGYNLDMKILDSKLFGVPQSRKRFFVLGSLNTNIKLPKVEKKIISCWEAISDLAYLEAGDGEFETKYKFAPKTKYQKKMRIKSNKLFNHKTTNHSNLVLKRLAMIPENGGKWNLPIEHHTGSTFGNTWSRLVKTKPADTITTRYDTPSSGRFTHPKLNRCITDREAARLQSFPDNFIFFGPKTSVMKQIGNAVPPLVAEEIAKTIKKDILYGK